MNMAMTFKTRNLYIKTFKRKEENDGIREKGNYKGPHVSMFDCRLFLSLPIDIRRNVYLFLGDNVQIVRPPPKSSIFSDEIIEYPAVTVTEYDNTLAERYEQHVKIYDYIPNFVSNWCRGFELVKQDPLVADRLKVCMKYEEENWFCMQWILVCGQLEVGIFTQDEQFLQVSYGIKEFCEVVDVPVQRLSLGMNVSEINNIEELCTEIKRHWLFDTVQFVSFVNCWDMEHPNVASIINFMENFNNLRLLKVESQNMFDNLINIQGVRANPGKTIVYNVRQNILELRAYSLRELGYKSLVNLSRWEQLVSLSLIGCEFIDLNKLVFPKRCKILNIQDIKYIVWWNQAEILEVLDRNWLNRTTISKPQSPEQVEKWYSVYIRVVETYYPINCITIQNVKRIKGNIIVPTRLLEDSRIKISNVTKMDEMLMI